MGFFKSLTKVAGPLLGASAALPVVGPTLGALGGSIMGYQETKETNKANAREAQLNRQFQERMSSTAHQRSVVDLRKAGLNPMLAAGSSASTPGGGQATMMSAANDVREGAKMGQLLREQLNNMKADTAQKEQAKKVGEQDEKLRKTQRALTAEQSRVANFQAISEWNRWQSVALDNRLKQMDVDFWTGNETARILNRLGINSGTAKDVQSLIKGMRRR